METTQVQQPQQQNGQQAQQPTNNGVARFSENTVDGVLKRITDFTQNGGLKLPANYSAENAVRSAWLIIQETKNMDKKPALDVCTRESVANALLDMVLQGLNPVKKQCYFVVYGNKLTLQKSYIGTMMISKRVANVKKVRAVPIYKGDEFAFEVNVETGIKKVTKHLQLFENIDPANVTGAYAIVTYNDDTVRAEVMNMKQIKASWEMGQAKGNSKAHVGFADQMACKTVIGRALKTDIGSSDDGDLFDEPIEPLDVQAANVQNTIDQNGNRTEIGFEEDVQEDYESGSKPHDPSVLDEADNNGNSVVNNTTQPQQPEKVQQNGAQQNQPAQQQSQLFNQPNGNTNGKKTNAPF